VETLILFLTYLACFVVGAHLCQFARRARAWGSVALAWQFNIDLIVNWRFTLAVLWLAAAVTA